MLTFLIINQRIANYKTITRTFGAHLVLNLLYIIYICACLHKNNFLMLQNGLFSSKVKDENADYIEIAVAGVPSISFSITFLRLS